jgi:hypothetical protein
MDSKYLKQFSNENIRRSLFNQKSVQPLEDILADELNRLNDLNKVKSSLDFGRSFDYNHLSDLFQSVRSDVDNFLQVKDIPSPTVTPFSIFDKEYRPIMNHYTKGAGWITGGLGIGILSRVFARKHYRADLKKRKRITRRGFLIGTFPVLGGVYQGVKGGLWHYVVSNDGGYLSWREDISIPKRMKRVKLEMTLCHEYTHHVQKAMSLYPDVQNKLWHAIEGHARGIDLVMSQAHRKKYDNLAYEHVYLSMSVPNLRSGYAWLCQGLGIQPKNGLLDRDFYPDGYEPTTPHAIGHSLFQIYRRELGDGIYRDMIHEKFVFPS